MPTRAPSPKGHEVARNTLGLSEDERRAQRACELAAFFMNALAPQPTSAVYERFYAELEPANQRKTFGRDRELLASLGVVIADAGWGDGEKLWRVDEEASFASGVELGALEAIALDVACQPLLADGGFAHGEALRHALAKIDRTFGDADQAVETSAPERGRAVKTLLDCAQQGNVALVTYRDAQGHQTKREFAPYGTFSCRNKGYVVGDFLEDGGAARRTLRLDRVAQARPTARAFRAPDDFCIDDYLLLPFQIGKTTCRAAFLVPGQQQEALRAASLGKGRFRRSGDNGAEGNLTWSVEVSSVDDAACWAVAQGIAPLSPSELVDAWRACLDSSLKGIAIDG